MTANIDEQAAAEVGLRAFQDKVSRGRQRLDVPDDPFMDQVLKWILRHNVEHVHGPGEVDYGVDELVVLVLLRNGRPYLKPFVEHYFALGAKHIVFLDNGSTDGTVEALRAYDNPNITVLRCMLPFKKYNLPMKQYLVERFGRGRWTLNPDMDELFEYPYSDVVSLKALLGYLNEHSYTAVVTYMLDMFPATLLPAEGSAEQEDLKELNRFYDISDVRTREYGEVGEIGNVVSNEQIEVLQGGVMERVFGTSPLLTKHPLIFLDERVKPHDLSDHWVGNARIADFTALFLHYKLSSSLYTSVRKEIEERRYYNRWGKYDRIHKVLQEAPSLLMRSETSKELKSVNELVGTRFVSVSEQYLNFVEAEAQKKEERYSEERRSERLSEAFFNARAEVAAYGQKTAELQLELKELRGRSRRKRATSRRAHQAEEQIAAIRASRAWKAMTAIHRLRLGAAQALERLRGYARKGG